MVEKISEALDLISGRTCFGPLNITSIFTVYYTELFDGKVKVGVLINPCVTRAVVTTVDNY